MTETLNSNTLRDINTGLVFREIQVFGPLSRAVIGKRTKLAPSTISVITSELLNKGLIRHSGVAKSSGGRKPVLLEVNPDGGYFICVDLSGVDISIGLLDLSFKTQREWTSPIRNYGEDLFADVVASAKMVETWCKAREINVLGLGVATPGLMDAIQGNVIAADNLGWFDFPLARRLASEFSTTIAIQHDMNAAAFGEYLYGMHDGTRNMIYVSVGNGIGCGLILNGQLFVGSDGLAGEIGHTVVDPHGTLCTCGNIGCLETVASGRAMVLEYRRMLQYVGRSAPSDADSYEVADILSEADRGQDIAKILVSRAGRAIGISIANLVNILNVDTVVLGGTLISKEGVMNQSILDGIYQCLLPRLRTRLRIRHSVLGSHAAYAGMAYLCLLKLFNTVSVV